MVRPAFDTTLADLADISVSVNRTTAQATATKPCIATVTIPAHLLQQILTAASLHMSDNPFQPEPEVGDHADMIAQNNATSQDWHWEMRDTIDILSARCSVAQSPDFPQNGQAKERSVATDRKHRELFAIMDRDERAKAEATDANTPDGLRARWNALNIKPLSNKQIVGLMVKLMEGKAPEGYSWNIVAPLFENYRKAMQKAEAADHAIKAARKVLGG